MGSEQIAQANIPPNLGENLIIRDNVGKFFTATHTKPLSLLISLLESHGSGSTFFPVDAPSCKLPHSLIYATQPAHPCTSQGGQNQNESTCMVQQPKLFTFCFYLKRSSKNISKYHMHWVVRNFVRHGKNQNWSDISQEDLLPEMTQRRTC